MRLAELSRRSGVPRSTIKFYIREGILPQGEPGASRNQATYEPRHLERLALVTALREIADLSVEVIKRVTADLVEGQGRAPISALRLEITEEFEHDRVGASRGGEAIRDVAKVELGHGEAPLSGGTC